MKTILISRFENVQVRIKRFVAEAREFYYQVQLSGHVCPQCGGPLRMTKPGQCVCTKGHVLDSTIQFQKSSCCQAALVRRINHYQCSQCGKTIPSKFLFDEQLFDARYFRERMQAHRDRKQKRREEIRRLLAQGRSNELTLLDEPRLEDIPGLLTSLDEFIASGFPESGNDPLEGTESYDFKTFRAHILNQLDYSERLFSRIPVHAQNLKLDKVWRFMTLLFMDQSREIDLSQYGADLLIRRNSHEAD